MDNTEHIITRLIAQLEVPVNIQQLFFELKEHPYYPSFLAISDILKKNGIDNLAFKPGADELQAIPTPFIAHISGNNLEYVLVTDINEQRVTLYNETHKNDSIAIAEFEKLYNGAVLLIDPKSVAKLKKKVKSNSLKVKAGKLVNPVPLVHPVTYLDVGASYGLPPKWEQYVNDENFNLIMVEPDAFQAGQLKKTYPGAQIIEVALGNFNGDAAINITASQSCSSVLEPDMVMLSRFPIQKSFRVVNSIETRICRFDTIVNKERISIPTFIKIDVQGYEYYVLEGFGDVLDEVLCIELETHFIPVYKKEKTLTEINNYLSNKGFYLRHLETVGSFEGEVIEFNAYFVNRKKCSANAISKQLLELWENINLIPEARRFMI